MLKGKVFGLVILICVCLPLCIGQRAYCDWQEIGDEVDCDDDDVGNSTWINWSMTCDAEGKEAKARIWPTTLGETYQFFKAESLTISSSRRTGYCWDDSPDDDADAQLFSLTWAGNVSANICTATADKMTDYSKATESGYAKVTSPDFGDGDSEKWQAMSDKGAHCVQNPPDANTGDRSQSLKITISAGLPTGFTGSLEWKLFAAGSAARTVTALESTNAVTAGASSATFFLPKRKRCNTSRRYGSSRWLYSPQPPRS